MEQEKHLEQSHKDTRNQYYREWREAHKEHIRAYKRRYYQLNKRHIQAYNRLWNQRNPEKKAEIMARYWKRRTEREQNAGAEQI